MFYNSILILFFFKGKSTITIQFVENHFVDTYNPTIENTFHKTLRHKGIDFITEIIDTAGQVRTSYFFCVVLIVQQLAAIAK